MPLPLIELSGGELFIPGAASGAPILKDLSWRIEAGSHSALVGPNGAGKTSLLKLLHGDLWLAKGSLLWAGAERMEASPIVGRRITGLVAPHVQAQCQRRGWNVSALEILAGARADAPLSFGYEPDEQALAEIHSLMRALRAESWLDLSMPEMSQGQLRIVLLARELLRKPRLLLLDEWSEGIDAERRGLCMEQLERLAGETTMVFAAHRQRAIPAWVSAARRIDSGRLGPEQPFRRTAKPNSKMGEEHAFPAVKTAAPAGKPIIELKNVSVYVSGKLILRDLNWTLREGEHWRICGPNGSGKSTFLRLLAGDEFVCAWGQMRLWLSDGAVCQSLAERRKQVSLASDLGEALYGYDLSAEEYALSGLENSIGVYREYSVEERSWARQLLVEFFGAEAKALAGRSIRALSSGQLRRLSLARALAAKPRVLLLDEPFSGLDEESLASYQALLADIAANGIAGIRAQIVLVSHQHGDRNLGFSNRAAHMDGGALVD